MRADKHEGHGKRELTHNTNYVGFIHFMLCNTINNWMAKTNVKMHKFYAEWQKATYKGITPYTAWDKICTVLPVHNPWVMEISANDGHVNH